MDTKDSGYIFSAINRLLKFAPKKRETMYRSLLLISLLIVFFDHSFAETIQLKSGSKTEGKIIDKIENYLVVKLNDGRIETYMLGDIDSIDGKAVNIFINGQKTEDIASKTSQTVQPGSSESRANLPFSTAVITYKYKGSHTGKEIVYIDVINNKIVQEIETSGHLMGRTLSKKEMNIYDGNMFYHIDLEKGRGTKEEWQGNCVAAIFKEKMYLDYYSGEDSFLGKVCKVYKPTLGTVYFWNGIILKEKIANHPLGKELNYTRDAIGIQLDAKIPAEKFHVPSGVKLLTGEEVMGEMKQLFEKMKSKCKK